MNETTDNKARLIEVKPCRQCGAKVKAEPGEFGGWVIFHECTAHGETESEAIEKWNRIEAAGLLAGSVGVPDPGHRREIRFVDATPDEGFPLRILQAYKETGMFTDNTMGLPPESEIAIKMNAWQEQRNSLLDKAIKMLTRSPEPKGRWISEGETFTLLRVSINRMMTSGKNADWDAFDDAASTALEGLEHLRTAPRAKEE